MRNLILIAFASFFLLSCGSSNDDYLMPNVTGSAFELVVVMEDEHYKSSPGELIREYLGADMDGLPQSEPIYRIAQIPKAAFSDIFKTHRNLMRVTISDDYRKNKLVFSSNLYAKPQLVIDIVASSVEEFNELFVKNAQTIVNKLNEIELSRIANNYRHYEDPEVGERLREKHNVSMIFPRGYKYSMDAENFAWIAHETPKHSQAVLVYYEDYVSEEQFDKERLIATRNKFLYKNVQGPIDHTYMTTQTDLPVEYREFMENGKYFVELRGLWELEGPDFMGGPFVSLTTVDTLRNKIVTVEGYTYAPRDDKRNFVRQLEAILHSVEFPPLKKEDE